jgi:hypothetical protein
MAIQILQTATARESEICQCIVIAIEAIQELVVIDIQVFEFGLAGHGVSYQVIILAIQRLELRASIKVEPLNLIVIAGQYLELCAL